MPLAKGEVRYKHISNDPWYGTRETIHDMFALIQADSLKPQCIDLARSIAKRSDTFSRKSVADALFLWVQSNIQYIRDPYGAEMVQTPLKTVELGFGDCDDMVTLLCALNRSVGNNIRLAIVAIMSPGVFDHVYCGVDTEEGWRAYDPSTPGAVPGWSPEDDGHHDVVFWECFDWGAIPLEGFFDDIGKFFERLWKKFRREVKRVSRRVRDEIKRTSAKINEEFDAWEDDLGFLGKFMVLGAKVGATAITAGALSPIVGAFARTVTPEAFRATQFAPGTPGAAPAIVSGPGVTVVGTEISAKLAIEAAIQIDDNPLKLTPEEWKFLAQLASTISSAVLSAVTAGGTSALLVASVLEIINTSVSAIDLVEELKMREEALDKIKDARARQELEYRLRREAMRKLESDMAAMRYLQQRRADHLANIEDIKAKWESKIAKREEDLKKRNQDILKQQFCGVVTHDSAVIGDVDKKKATMPQSDTKSTGINKGALLASAGAATFFLALIGEDNVD